MQARRAGLITLGVPSGGRAETRVGRSIVGPEQANPTVLKTLERKMKTIWDALSEKADGVQHAMFFELKLCTGWSGSEQRLDAWSIPLWPSLGNNIVAYEVKTARSDFLREIKNPEKRLAGIKRSNQFYFVTSAKVVREPNEIPEECGWIEFMNGELIERKPAPVRECEKPDWGTVKAICRRAFGSEVIALNRKLQAVMEQEKSRSEVGTHRVVDDLGEWLMRESKGGDRKTFEQLKALLAPANLYQWAEYRAPIDV